MNEILCSTLLLLLISAAPTDVRPQPKTDAITVAGCLQKGASNEAFTLMTDSKSYEVAGTPDLGRHVGHQIEVSGNLTIDAKGDSRVDVKTVKMIATSCSKGVQ
jgi:hypothetical protein